MNGLDIRVGILSTSSFNRNHLRTLLKAQGASIVCTGDIKGFIAPKINPPDVLLVDLDSADDSALDALDELNSDSPVPVLISDGMSFPEVSSPEAATLSTNLMKKLRDAVTKKRQQQKPKPKQSQRASTTKTATDDTATTGPVRIPTKKAPQAAVVAETRVPATNANLKKSGVTLGIISKSRTRSMAMAKLLANFPRVTHHVFGPGFDPGRILGGSDIILIDRHNLGAEELPCFKKMTGQRSVPFVLCNSSEMTMGGATSKNWSVNVTKQLRAAFDQHAVARRQKKNPAAAAPQGTSASMANAASAHAAPGQVAPQWDTDQKQVREILRKLPADDRSPKKSPAPPAHIKAEQEFSFDDTRFDVPPAGKKRKTAGDLLSDNEALALAGIDDDTFDLHYEPFDSPGDFREEDLPDITQFITGPDGEFGLHNPFHLEEQQKQGNLKSWLGGILSALRKDHRAG